MLEIPWRGALGLPTVAVLRRAILLVPLAGACLGSSDALAQAQPAVVTMDRAGGVLRPARVQAWLDAIYGTQRAPVWFTADGPRTDVQVALDAMRHAADHGLEPDDYNVDAVQSAVRQAADMTETQTVAATDAALTMAVLRFMSDLRFGRVDPSTVAPRYRATPPKDMRFVNMLRSAVAEARLADLLRAVEPAFPQYRRLEALLARYRRLAQEPFAALPLPKVGKRSVAVGDDYEGVAQLYDRLRGLGDLDATTPPPGGPRYTEAIAVGVRRFQHRHGLDADGVLGKSTLAALDVSPERRATQIVVSLERLRWVPDFGNDAIIAINLPSFRLWVFGDASRDHADLAMPVIVGKAMRNETPVFIGTMRLVEFSPYWNVPRSILRNELLPQLMRDRSLLRRDDMELVDASGQASSSDVLDDAALAALQAGRLRVRQRPGPANALGRVKFVLPNTMDIYLHDTPATQLFERSRRDFSHGCIRVGDPAALAAFVLSGNGGWTRADVDAAMSAGMHRVVPLAAPVPVIVFYTTVIVDRDGQAWFLPDLYGQDTVLLRALRRASPGFGSRPAP